MARKDPYSLDEPEPIVHLVNFGESALELLFAVWCVKTDYLELSAKIMQEIKERFDAEGFEILFPHRTLCAGAAAEPFPVRVVSDGHDD